MIRQVSKQLTAIQTKYPFIRNFPFDADFEIETAQPLSDIFKGRDNPFVDDLNDPQLIRFVYNNDITVAIVIHEKELNWLNAISDQITDLDSIAKITNMGLVSNDLIIKRDAADAGEAWLDLVQDKHVKLSYSTFGEVLAALITSEEEFVDVANKILKLTMGKGLVGLTYEEYQIISTYFHFQLIYTKLILGIIIAAKIT